jgi:dTDP-4-amino-4,6-dideoxygalactose transaminase
MSENTDELWLFKSYADENDVAAVTEVIERGTWWAKGQEIEEFEELIAGWTDREHGIAFNSGTSALYANLLANGITSGEVIVPSFTFQATANAVVAAGAKPVFADIERDSLALNPDDVAEKAGPETQAIMPIHFAGDICAGIRDLRYIAHDHGAVLFEDACHSPGATLDGKPVGSFGKSATFSFCFNKIITTGEGGMVVTDNDHLRERLELIRSHGCDENGKYVTYGHNFRMATMAAALGVSQAEKLDYIISRRREMAGYLNEQLSDLADVQCPVFPEERDSVYQLYNIRFDDPSIQPALQGHLSAQGIPTRVTYDPVHLSRYYRDELGCEPGDLPVTEDVSDKILTLPFHLDLSNDDLDRIATGVRSFFE